MNTTNRIVRRIKTVWLELIVMKAHIVGCIVPFHHLRRAFYRIVGMKIGSGSGIHMKLTLFNPAGISIGEDTIIGEKCSLDGRAKLTIGNHVDIASEVMIYNSEHDVNDPKFGAIVAPVTIEDYVFIGPRADVRQRAQAVDAGIGPEIDQHHLAFELRGRERRRERWLPADPAPRADARAGGRCRTWR